MNSLMRYMDNIAYTPVAFYKQTSVGNIAQGEHLVKVQLLTCCWNLQQGSIRGYASFTLKKSTVRFQASSAAALS